jgi:hypothetical protein
MNKVENKEDIKSIKVVVDHKFLELLQRVHEFAEKRFGEGGIEAENPIVNPWVRQTIESPSEFRKRLDFFEKLRNARSSNFSRLNRES